MTIDDDQVEKHELPAEKPAPAPRDPALLQRVFDRTTIAGPNAMKGGGDLIPLKTVTFDVDGSECAPGMFVDEAGGYITFSLTLTALTSVQEVKCTKGCQDPAEAVQRTAKASLKLLNDAPIIGDQLDFLWEALGPGGRQLCLVMYQDVGAVSPAGMGKAQASSIVG